MEASKAGHALRERHTPVLLQEVLEFLAVRPNGVYIDCTVGFAGHSGAIAERLGPEGRLIGLDRDASALELARERLAGFGERVELHHAEFSRVGEFARPGTVNGILADFGVSSMHLDDAHRGFSFQADGPLDMRMNPRGDAPTAAQVVNEADEEDLANLIYELGEERRSRRIARAIVRARPLDTTAQLAAVIKKAAPSMNRQNRDAIHPATRTFQALRIHVNREVDEIRALLQAAPELLQPGGRLVVISFHSLEDRPAKDALREGRDAGVYEVLTRKPVTAGEEETRRNPRSRSAKLRAAERLAPHTRSGRVVLPHHKAKVNPT